MLAQQLRLSWWNTTLREEHGVKTPGNFRAIQPAAEAEGPWEVPSNHRKNATDSQVSSDKWEMDCLDRKMASKVTYVAKLKELEESLESNYDGERPLRRCFAAVALYPGWLR